MKYGSNHHIDLEILLHYTDPVSVQFPCSGTAVTKLVFGHKGGSMKAFSVRRLSAAMLAPSIFGRRAQSVRQAKRVCCNAAYQAQDYKKAKFYEETRKMIPSRSLFLPKQLDNMYRPSKKGDPETKRCHPRGKPDLRREVGGSQVEDRRSWLSSLDTLWQLR